ncbi:MAG: AAA-like domain-containing protein, partial [Dolichospermum sp.]
LTLSQFLKIAHTNQSPYSCFLKSYLLELEKDVLLKRAMQQVINSNIPIPIDSKQAFKLRSLGLIEFKGNEVQCLCDLYRLYFCSRL